MLVKQSYSNRKNPFFVHTVDYDFARDGGATSAINLGGTIPSGAIVLGGYLRVVTGFTTGTSATGAISVNAANDLQTATIVSGAPFSTTGMKSLVPVGSGATMIKLTADRNPTFTIGTGTVTAGAFVLTLLCLREL